MLEGADAPPAVSVIIPVKCSARTIRTTVESLLTQKYSGNSEIILVGDRNDPTWAPIADWLAAGRIRKIEINALTAGRDANIKRNVGVRHASGEIIAFTDSDMVLPDDWLATGVRLLGEGWPCVAGPMKSVAGDFWGRYVDTNDLGSKTPRMRHAYVVTAANYGRRGVKPAITANLFFARHVIERVGLFDETFVYCYEDYEYMRRVADAGFATLCTGALLASHYHRQGFRALAREYRRSGMGTGDYIVKYPKCRLSRVRIGQLVMAYFIALAFLAGSALQPLTVAIGAIGAAGVCGITARRSGALAACAYPGVTLVLGLAYVVGVTTQLSRGVGRAIRQGRAAEQGESQQC